MQYLLRFFSKPDVPMSPSGSANGWIPIRSWSWAGSMPNYAMVTSKASDGTSQSLCNMCASGTTIPIAILRAVGNDGKDTYRINLVNAAVDSIQTGESGETMSMTFDKAAYNALAKAPDVTHSARNTDYEDDD